MLIKELKDMWLKIEAPKREKNTVQEYIRIWDKYIIPKIGHKLMSELTKPDLLMMYSEMRETPAMANRTIAVLRAAFKFATHWDVYKPQNSNPFSFPLEKEQARERYPSQAEAKQIFKALDCMKQQYPSFVGFIWLLTLTGCRPSEIQKAKWEWIDDIGMHLPTAKRKKKGRTISLSKSAREVLKTLPKQENNPYLIIGDTPGSHLKHRSVLWNRLRKITGIKDLQMRDLRRYFATLMLSSGVGLDQVSRVLGHQNTQTTLIYAKLLNEEGEKGAQLAADKLDNLLKG